MEGRIKHLLAAATRALLPLAAITAAMTACGSDAPPMGDALRERDSMAVMVTNGVSKLISDSGVVRYKIIAEEWRVYDRTNPQRQEFPKGIYLERLDNNFRVDLYIVADSAWCYDQNLWELRGRVFINNFADGTTFSTEKLFWDMDRHELYSDVYMHIVTPERDVEGNWFRSNESMTRYYVKQTKGFMPMPSENGGTPAEAAAPVEDTETDSLPDVARPRDLPRKRTAADTIR